MSEGDANDLPKQPMPWETGATEDAASGGSSPPSPDAAPTEVVPTPEPAEPPQPVGAPTLAEPIVPPPAAGLISAAPVGWGAPQPPGGEAVGAPGSDIAAPAVGWGSPEPTGRDVPGAPGFVFASTATRLVAYLTDIFVTWFIGFTIAAVVVAVLYNADLVSADSTRSSFLSGVLIWVIALLFNLVYFVFFWSGGRRSTPGQRLFHIQVGNAVDGRQLDVTQAAVRWLGYGQWFVVFGFLSALSSIVGLISLAWPFLLLITTIISPTKQGLHDRIAGTWLVRPAAADSSGLALGCILLLGLLVIIPIVAIIGLIFLGGQVSTILSAVGDSV